MVTLEMKIEIIKNLRLGKSQRLVADLPKSTVSDIWKIRERILEHVSSSDCPGVAKKRCIVREATFSKVDEACYIWFLQQRSKGAAVSGPIVQQKALLLFPTLYPDLDPSSFKASTSIGNNIVVAGISG